MKEAKGSFETGNRKKRSKNKEKINQVGYLVICLKIWFHMKFLNMVILKLLKFSCFNKDICFWYRERLEIYDHVSSGYIQLWFSALFSCAMLRAKSQKTWRATVKHRLLIILGQLFIILFLLIILLSPWSKATLLSLFLWVPQVPWTWRRTPFAPLFLLSSVIFPFKIFVYIFIRLFAPFII